MTNIIDLVMQNPLAFGSVIVLVVLTAYLIKKYWINVIGKPIYVFDPRYKSLIKTDYNLNGFKLYNDVSSYDLTDFLFVQSDKGYIILALYEKGELIPLKLYITDDEQRKIYLAIEEMKIDQILIANIMNKVEAVEIAKNKNILEKILEKRDVIVFSAIIFLGAVVILLSSTGIVMSTIEKQARAIEVLLNYSNSTSTPNIIGTNTEPIVNRGG